MTTFAETRIKKAKTKKNTPGYKHPGKKTGTQRVLSSVLKQSMSGFDRGKVFMGGFIVAIVILSFSD